MAVLATLEPTRLQKVQKFDQKRQLDENGLKAFPASFLPCNERALEKLPAVHGIQNFRLLPGVRNNKLHNNNYQWPLALHKPDIHDSQYGKSYSMDYMSSSSTIWVGS